MPAKITIEKLVYGGDGLARIDGQVLLAPFVLPGERVAVETRQTNSGLLRGDSPQVLESSLHRIQPRCEYFGSCGGCQYQHSAYEYQLEQKAGILRETLRRLGGVTYEENIPVISGDPWFYRNRVQLHFEGRASGFRKAGSHNLQPIDHCYISAPLLVEAIARMQEAVKRQEWPVFLRSLELFTNGTELQMNVLDAGKPVAARFFSWCATFLPALVPGALEYAAAGYVFRISGGSFFQVNRFLIEALVEEVLNGAAGTYALDLYAGVGLFSLPLAQKFQRVRAIERGSSGFRDLQFNLAQTGAPVEAVHGSAEAELQRAGDHPAPDLVVADPPRAGLERQATDAILTLRPARIAVVSCDPATLARDARKLLTQYRIRRLALIDLFPQTYHFETVMHLELA